VEALFGFGIIQPFFTELLGYFPAHGFGLEESLPKIALMTEEPSF